MEFSDLVPIGKLGRIEPDGFYCIHLGQLYKSILNQLSECFLIFNSHRVFFVTVVEIQTRGTRSYLRFQEDGIAEECRKSSSILVALPSEDLADLSDQDDFSRLFGFSVHYNNEEIGSLADAMISSLQAVLVIMLRNGRELLVPNVEHYVREIDVEHQLIILQNLESLLEVCTSTS